MTEQNDPTENEAPKAAARGCARSRPEGARRGRPAEGAPAPCPRRQGGEDPDRQAADPGGAPRRPRRRTGSEGAGPADRARSRPREGTRERRRRGHDPGPRARSREAEDAPGRRRLRQGRQDHHGPHRRRAAPPALRQDRAQVEHTARARRDQRRAHGRHRDRARVPSALAEQAVAAGGSRPESRVRPR